MTPNYELSDNQKLFVKDAEEQGFDIDYEYSGRGMYGKECPAVRVGRYEKELVSHSRFNEDSLGMGVVQYAQY